MMNRSIYVLFLALGLTSCAQLNNATKLGSSIAAQAGLITSTQAASLQRVSETVEKTSQDITPSQEYYLGRSVSATLLSKYPVSSRHIQANRYLNLIGKTLVLSSDKPETYGNYHFAVLDSDQINAFAAPSGFIFVTKGMIRLCKNEDDLAAVLAHEISHVLHSHALKSIKTSHITSALTIIGSEAVKTYAGNVVPAELLQAFEGSIDDVTQTLVNSGYGRGLESEADKTAVTLLQNAGYNAESLLRVLNQLKANTKPNSADFSATHPDTDDRISDVTGWLQTGAVNPVSAVRTARFYSVFKQL
jgi:predicted Zn-dependent protease